MLFFWCQFISWLPQFLLYTVCYLIIVRCGQNSKSFHKDNERLAKNEAFCGQGLGKNGVCKRQMTLYLQFYGSSMAQKAKISSSHPQVSPKVVRNGERSRIESLLVARFDAKDVADRPQWLSIRQQETSAEEIVTFYSELFIVCCTVL